MVRYRDMEQLIAYITESLKRGVNETTIRQSLLNAGWNSETIDGAFVQIRANDTVKSPGQKIFPIAVIALVGLGIVVTTAIYLLNNKTDSTATEVVTVPEPTEVKGFDDSDLVLEKTTIQVDNAYYELIKINDIYHRLEYNTRQQLDDMAKGKNWNDEIVNEMIANNTEALATLAKASKRSVYQNPEWANPENVSYNSVIPPLNSWRDIALIANVNAQKLVREKKYDEAYEQISDILKVSYLIRTSRISFIEYLVAEVMYFYGLEASLYLTNHTADKAVLLEIVNQLDEYDDTTEGLVDSYKMEYLYISKVLETIADADESDYETADLLDVGVERKYLKLLKDRRYFDPEKTKGYHASLWRKQIINATRDCWNFETVDRLTPPGTFTTSDAGYAFDDEYLHSTDNSFGKILFDMSTDSATDINQLKCETQAKTRVVQTVVGMKAYRLDNGAHPKTVEQLAPDYLKVIPTDPYDGKPIKYIQEKKMVYSIGSNMLDDGGDVSDSEDDSSRWSWGTKDALDLVVKFSL